MDNAYYEFRDDARPFFQRKNCKYSLCGILFGSALFSKTKSIFSIVLEIITYDTLICTMYRPDITVSNFMEYSGIGLKDLYSCPFEIIKGLSDKGQFQYLTG